MTRHTLGSQPDYSVLKRGGDPYVYPATSVLRNLYGLQDAQKLQQLESRLTNLRLMELSASTVKVPNTLQGLQSIHHYIFQDVYAWAGGIRKVSVFKSEEVLSGASAAYSDPNAIVKDAGAALRTLNSRPWTTMALDEKAATLSQDVSELWRVHAFREGNTRTVVAFMDKFTREHEMQLDLNLLRENADYVRRSLVMATVDRPEYLGIILKDAMDRGAALAVDKRPVLVLAQDEDRSL